MGITPFSGADGNGDGNVTQADYNVWRSNFGKTLPAPIAGSGIIAVASASAAFLTDEQAEGSSDREATPAALDRALLDWSSTRSALNAAGNNITSLLRVTAGESATSDKLLLLAEPQHRRTADHQNDGVAEHRRRKSSEFDDIFAELGEKQSDTYVARAFFGHAL
jgi:hypothetical protein